MHPQDADSEPSLWRNRQAYRYDDLIPCEKYPPGMNVNLVMQDLAIEKHLRQTLKSFEWRGNGVQFRSQRGRARKYPVGAQCLNCDEGQQTVRNLCKSCYSLLRPFEGGKKDL